jgi:hypothetical protein
MLACEGMAGREKGGCKGTLLHEKGSPLCLPGSSSNKTHSHAYLQGKTREATQD